MHEGHRQRLKKRFLEEGLDGLLQAHPEYLLWAAGGLLGLAVLILLVILAQGRRR